MNYYKKTIYKTAGLYDLLESDLFCNGHAFVGVRVSPI